MNHNPTLFYCDACHAASDCRICPQCSKRCSPPETNLAYQLLKLMDRAMPK